MSAIVVSSIVMISAPILKTTSPPAVSTAFDRASFTSVKASRADNGLMSLKTNGLKTMALKQSLSRHRLSDSRFHDQALTRS